MAGDKWVALRLAYLGWNYYGVVRQPGLRTIEDCLSEALEEQGITARLRFSSRTDRGVSALDNIATYRGDPPNLSWLNASLPNDVAVWGVIVSNERTRALRKTYLYTVPLELDPRDLYSSLKDALNSPLCKEGEAPKPEFEIRQISGLTQILVTGRSFCWQMVRRLVGRALSPILMRRINVAPPEGLILLKTEIGREWDFLNMKKLHVIQRELEKEMWKWGMGLFLIRLMREIISSGRLSSSSLERTT